MIRLKKDKQTLKEVKTGVKDNKYSRGGNNSNKFYAFTKPNEEIDEDDQ